MWRYVSRLMLSFPIAAGLVQGAAPVAAPPPAPEQQPSPRGEILASIKLDKAPPFFTIGFAPGGRFVTMGAPLRMIIAYAYNTSPSARMLRSDQVLGGPGWLDAELYDIEAKSEDAFPPGTVGETPAMHEMVKRLLAERFGLRLHVEMREVPIYRLTLATRDGRPGSQLRPTTLDCQGRTGPPRNWQPGQPGRFCGVAGTGSPTKLAGGDATMAQLAEVLSGRAGRPVQNHTGIEGRFDFDLDWTPEDLTPRAAGDDQARPLTVAASLPFLFTALREQLGLKLEADKAPGEIFIIDHVERPTND